MKKLSKQLLSFLLSVLMVVSAFYAVPLSAITTDAASFNDINNSSVFVKQQTNYTCTLASAVMMVRRAAMMTGNSNWASITESSMRPTAWDEGGGLWHKFTYAGISVAYATLSGGSGNKSTLINLLASHPEGIVAYRQNSAQYHAVLLTDYTNGTFYCADPALGNGRIALTSSTIGGSGQDGKIANFTSYWYVSSPKCTLSDITPPQPSITYTGITPNVYYLKCNGSSQYTYLNVAYGKDENAQNVHTHSFGDYTSEQMSITATTTGYKIRPLCCASRLINPYGDIVKSGLNVNIYNDMNDSSQWWRFQKVSGGYVIRNVQNANCVLDGVNNGACVTTYTGASTQIWTLIERDRTIKYDANGGSGAPGNQTYTYYPGGNVALSSTVPTKYGYEFLGWSTDKNAASATYKSGQNWKRDDPSATLYAVWKPITYTVTYVPNGGSGSMSASTHTYDTAKTLNINAFTRDGYSFAGWGISKTATIAAFSDGQSVKNISSKKDATVALYALWNPVIYTITYNANGGSGSMSASTHTYDTAKELTSNSFTREGYTFLGWSLSPTATTAKYKDAQSVTNLTAKGGENVTLYAVWKATSTETVGDVNGDGVVDAADAGLISRYDAGLIKLTAEQLKAGDVNGDGDVDAGDAGIISRYDAGLLSSLKLGG